MKLHFDGWLMLPPMVCSKLGLGTGDELQVEILDGNILLRRHADRAEAKPDETVTKRSADDAQLACPVEAPAAAPPPPKRSGRKAPAIPPAPPPLDPPKTRAVGGRRKGAPTA